MTLTPNVWAYFPGRELPTAGVVNSHRKECPAFSGLGHVFTGLDGTVNSPRMTPNHRSDGLTLLLDGRSGQSHTLKTNTFRKARKDDSYGNRKVANTQQFTETDGVRIWNRDLFVRLVKAKKDAGVPLAEIASALDMAESTLQGFLDQKARPPSKRMLELAPAYLGVDLDELWIENLSEEGIELRHARAMLRDSMGHEMAETFSDEAALKWYRLALSVLNVAGINTPGRVETRGTKA